jgi:hypothetical protein
MKQKHYLTPKLYNPKWEGLNALPFSLSLTLTLSRRERVLPSPTGEGLGMRVSSGESK